MFFVLISEQTAISIFLYSIIVGFFFINETECVYCAVRTGSLNIMQVKSKPESLTQLKVSLHNDNLAAPQ